VRFCHQWALWAWNPPGTSTICRSRLVHSLTQSSGELTQPSKPPIISHIVRRVGSHPLFISLRIGQYFYQSCCRITVSFVALWRPRPRLEAKAAVQSRPHSSYISVSIVLGFWFPAHHLLTESSKCLGQRRSPLFIIYQLNLTSSFYPKKVTESKYST
jgi:hypothetical protein